MSERVLFSKSKVSLVVPVFKNVALLVFFLWLVVFEKLVNNRIVDHLEPCGLFCDFLYGFMSSQSTADLLTVVSDRIATQAAALDIFKAFNRV